MLAKGGPFDLLPPRSIKIPSSPVQSSPSKQASGCTFPPPAGQGASKPESTAPGNLVLCLCLSCACACPVLVLVLDPQTRSPVSISFARRVDMDSRRDRRLHLACNSGMRSLPAKKYIYSIGTKPVREIMSCRIDCIVEELGGACSGEGLVLSSTLSKLPSTFRFPSTPPPLPSQAPSSPIHPTSTLPHIPTRPPTFCPHVLAWLEITSTLQHPRGEQRAAAVLELRVLRAACSRALALSS
jgi:hypothetical protein